MVVSLSAKYPAADGLYREQPGFCSQHKGSDWSRLDVVGIGWIGLGCRVLDRKSRRQNRFFVRPAYAFSALAVCQDLYFRTHYFIMILPAVSLLVGVAIEQIVRSSGWSNDCS